jgi:TRAP-type C4-dicarboxylate transport system substrate-binding protein
MSKREFDKLSPEDQKILKDTAREFSKKLVAATRADNVKSIEALKKQGLQFVKVEPKEEENLRAISAGVWDALAGKLYPPELLAEAKGYLAEVRAKLQH